MKRLCILGATGSIGTQTLEIVRRNRKKFSVESISFNNNLNLALDIIKEFNVKVVATIKSEYKDILLRLNDKLIVFTGEEALSHLSTYHADTIVVNALVGIAGLKPTVKALEMGKKVLLANKETLVAAGDVVNDLLNKHHGQIFPIDSEHSAIFQCLKCGKKKEVKSLIITASGGSLRDKTIEEMKNVTLDDVLKHPNWEMGKKVTIDSATMVNKGLEVIEAHYLFNLSYDKIKTIIHRQSIIHSMVEYVDGSVIMEAAKHTMLIPIQYALSYPKRIAINENDFLDFSSVKKLSFEEMDFNKYPLLSLAYYVGKEGGLLPCVYNASNEAAVNLFINGKIRFTEIEEIIKSNVYNFKNVINPSLEEILETDKIIKLAINNKYEVK